MHINAVIISKLNPHLKRRKSIHARRGRREEDRALPSAVMMVPDMLIGLLIGSVIGAQLFYHLLGIVKEYHIRKYINKL